MKKDEKKAEIKPTEAEVEKMAKGTGQIVLAPKPEIEEYQRESQSIETMITTAIKQKVDPATMKEFLAMRKELKAEYAKEQFVLAMANFQSELSEIKKTKEVRNDAGKLLYKYAPLDAIVSQAKEPLAKNGLSYSVKTEVSADKVKSIVTIRHIAGHSEDSEMETPLATKTGIMSQPQQIAATATFSKRYAFMNALGIMTGDEDNEKALTEEPATEDQINDAIGKLDKCSTVEGLTETWRSLSKEQKANKDLIIHANMIKSNIEDAKQKGV